MSKQYTMSTNPYTLSIVKDVLKEIEIENIPLFDEKDNELREYISTSIILELSDDIKKLNAMFKAITQDADTDFGLFKFDNLFEILNDFFMSTGDRLISWKKIQSLASISQSDTDIGKLIETMATNPSLLKMLSTPTENTLEA